MSQEEMLDTDRTETHVNVAELAATVDGLRHQLEATCHQQDKTRRQMWCTWMVAAVGSVGAFVLGLHPEARAQVGVTLASLNTRLSAVETKTQDMTRLTDPNTNKPTVRFTGINVQIVNGIGSTAQDIEGENRANGVGNLIIGYNELRTTDSYTNTRTGSHYLIVGDQLNYSYSGGIVAGQFNEASNYFASVTGGQFNTASGRYSSVSGGGYNTAQGMHSSISGGIGNTASGFYNCVSGGSGNTASGLANSISGGTVRTLSGNFGWAAGTGSGTTYTGTFTSE